MISWLAAATMMVHADRGLLPFRFSDEWFIIGIVGSRKVVGVHSGFKNSQLAQDRGSHGSNNLPLEIANLWV